ncbi:Pesticin receptor [Andreprevotia sp. IGB-42]|uniref:TonB-dependent receptor n=1 Tax=Andreprevotia sp. IGB-42 TaxID=2497473 RepID=UPI0013577862|nr:TonB-dependent receptor [Andreprevotia sp. IGB-42]KAF0812624.1 Pesticin receptor [Andreprevotia sp. IGB-42]
MRKSTATRQRSYRLFLATRLALASLAGIAASGAVYADDAVTLPTVTVTGEKIDRSQQDTTTAVSVFQTPKVDDGQNHNINELAQEVPNATHNAAGGINIRGVAGSGPTTGVFTFISGARPRVSTTVDGAPETWAGQQYLDVGLWDVEQVEVLRGPQSTIQGRNAMAGAVVVNTKDPSFTLEGAARVGVENEDGRTYVAGMVSGPIVSDELAFRLAVEGTKGNGFIDYQGSYPWDPSELQNYTVRGKLLWTPSAAPQLKAKLTLIDRKYKGEYLNRIETPCSNADCSNEGDLFKNYAFYGKSSNTRRQDSKGDTANIDIDYQFNDVTTGHLLYSRGNDKLHFEESGADRFFLDQDQKSNTLEGRVVYNPKEGRVSGVAGLYYFDRKQNLLAADPLAITFTGDDKVETIAGYAEATIGLNERFDLIAGGRVERESQKRDLDAWPGKPWAGVVDTDKSETMFLPKIGVQYKLADTTLGFTVRKGYNPGGGGLDWVTSAYYEYDKEEVVTYEATSRSVLLDNRLSLNATAFYNNYTGYQALYNYRLVNIGKGTSYGLELDAAAQVTTGLSLYGSVGLLHTEVTDGGQYGARIKGNEFDSAPALTANLGFRQKFGGYWFVSGNVSYTGEYFSGIDNDNREKAGDYVLANLQAGYDHGNYAIRFYVKNLFDQDILYAKNIGSDRWPSTQEMIVGDVGAPRTFGVVLDYRF